jgi:hypothetical protein
MIRQTWEYTQFGWCSHIILNGRFLSVIHDCAPPFPRIDYRWRHP